MLYYIIYCFYFRLVQKYKNRLKEMDNIQKKELAGFDKNYKNEKGNIMRSNSKISMVKSEKEIF